MFDDLIRPAPKEIKESWLECLNGTCVYCFDDEPLVFEDCEFHRPDCRGKCYFLVSYDGINVTQCSKHTA